MTGSLALELVQAGATLAGAGTIHPGEGNLSVRCGRDSFLVTAGGTDKGRLDEDDLVVVALSGEDVPRTASRETQLHREVYRRRADVGSIVHAHPRRILEVSALGSGAVEDLTREARGSLGVVSWLPYLEPGSRSLAVAAAEALQNAESCVLDGHGAVSTGDSLDAAVRRMLLLESLAEEMVGR